MDKYAYRGVRWPRLDSVTTKRNIHISWIAAGNRGIIELKLLNPASRFLNNNYLSLPLRNLRLIHPSYKYLSIPMPTIAHEFYKTLPSS